MSDYVSPLMQRYGTFSATGADAGVAAHYGDPMREQRRLARATDQPVIVDFSHLGVVTVTGADRGTWLTTLSSQVMTSPDVARGSELLLMSVQGRIEFYAHAVEAHDTVWLIVERDQAQPLTDFLNSMKFMLRVEIENRTAEYAVVGSTQNMAQLDAAPDTLKDAVTWCDPWPGIVTGGFSYAATDDHPGTERNWYQYILPAEHLEALGESCELAGTWAAEALRVEAWRPRAAYEIDEKTIPHELDLMRTAVHLNKGCYKGQETVARVHNLGHPPRRLVFLDLDGTEHTQPPVGSAVYAGTKKVGRVTSVALHHEAGPIALAVIKRNVDPKAQLIVSEESLADDGEKNAPTVDYAASQMVIVAPDAGQVVGRRNMGDFLR
ncbi:CAF17-like 4Fe-4S cluster assembly/insertion protein YgfZ [Rothia terrae]|uniref:CAF17-like 4Fe-4S cluster assembly/insertion protein YgfZ n=1 Tax=Rothia terrae TaxID=396015 RepID=UPI0028811DC0|nr:folate-binding protein [Rothia terrae]MDT0189846.1 folate-binding protein [Rothia terrae]